MTLEEATVESVSTDTNLTEVLPVMEESPTDPAKDEYKLVTEVRYSDQALFSVLYREDQQEYYVGLLIDVKPEEGELWLVEKTARKRVMRFLGGEINMKELFAKCIKEERMICKVEAVTSDNALVMSTIDTNVKLTKKIKAFLPVEICLTPEEAAPFKDAITKYQASVKAK